METTETPSTQGSKYNPDVALINFYKEGDTLGGHLDDVEKDLSKPIVSFSLGCEAIFLIGGTLINSNLPLQYKTLHNQVSKDHQNYHMISSGNL